MHIDNKEKTIENKIVKLDVKNKLIKKPVNHKYAVSVLFNNTDRIKYLTVFIKCPFSLNSEKDYKGIYESIKKKIKVDFAILNIIEFKENI